MWRRGDFSSLSGTWNFSGDVGRRRQVRERSCSTKRRRWRLPLATRKLEITDNLGDVLNPPGSGGLLAALHIWRKLQGRRPAAFWRGDLSGHRCRSKDAIGLVDVLLGTTGGVECHFMFDPADGTLLAMEMYPQDDADPCEVYFSEYREVGRAISCPTASKSATATTCSIVFNVTKYDLQKGTAEMSRDRRLVTEPNFRPAVAAAGSAAADCGRRVRFWQALAIAGNRGRSRPRRTCSLAAARRSAGPSLRHAIGPKCSRRSSRFRRRRLRGLEPISKRLSDLGRRLHPHRLEPRARHRRRDGDSRRRPQIHQQAGRRRSARWKWPC